MSLVLVYDTETTGFPDFKAPSDSAHQPHIVDICGLLFDASTRELVASYEAMVRPDGWSIPPEVSAIHGIDDAMAMEHGVPEAEAIAAFHALAIRASVRVAHNESFDARIVRIAHVRFSPEQSAIEWQDGNAFCTCQASKSRVAIPPTPKMRARGMTSYKPPNLAEALKHFTGDDLPNAHRARPDTEACARIYWALVDARETA